MSLDDINNLSQPGKGSHDANSATPLLPVSKIAPVGWLVLMIDSECELGLEM